MKIALQANTRSTPTRSGNIIAYGLYNSDKYLRSIEPVCARRNKYSAWYYFFTCHVHGWNRCESHRYTHVARLCPYSKSVPEKRERMRVYVPATHEGDYISRARLEYLPGGPWDRRVKQNVKLSIFHEQSIISGCIIGPYGMIARDASSRWARARARRPRIQIICLPPS